MLRAERHLYRDAARVMDAMNNLTDRSWRGRGRWIRFEHRVTCTMRSGDGVQVSVRRQGGGETLWEEVLEI